MTRTTCIHCEQEGVVTPLIQTGRGGACPIHSAEFLAAVTTQAQQTSGLMRPELLGRGVPRRS